MKKTEKKQTKNVKKFNSAYLAFFAPILLAGIYILLLIATSNVKYTPGGFHFIVPLGQQDVSEFSFVTLIIVAATFYGWGALGYIAAEKRAKLLPALLAAHAIPLLSTSAFIIFSALNMPDLASVSTIGFGTFLFFGNFIYQLVALNSVEIAVNIVSMTAAYVIGYSIGVTKGEKK